MAEKLIKSFTVGSDTGKIDYESLANKPFAADEVARLKTLRTREVKIINYVEDSSKTDHRPAKDHAYGDGKIDSVQILRYACPERIDNDGSVDEAGELIDGFETHLDYVKDVRPMLARDGDFGFPEVDGTGQFNFRPVYNTTGYVLKPEVWLDAEGTIPAVEGTDYNHFKTPWNTGIKDLYRLSKVASDLFVDIKVLKESEMAAHTVNYEIVAPSDYPDDKLPTILLFRCADHSEKYFKYFKHSGSYKTLDEEYINGIELEFTKATTAEGEPKKWTATGITYLDDTGYPDAGTKSRVIFMMDKTNMVENYTISPSAAPRASYGNLNAGDFGPTFAITKITDDITVTFTIAAPANVSYPSAGHEITYVDSKGATKVEYGWDPEKTPTPVAQGSAFDFKMTFDKDVDGDKHGDHFGYYEDADKVVHKADGSLPGKSDACAFIESITIGGVSKTPTDVIDSVAFTTKKATFTFKASEVTGDIVITLGERPESPLNA